MGHNGQGHKNKNAQQKPIHVVIPGKLTIHVGKIFLNQRPPDVNDQGANQQKSTEEVIAVTRPAKEFAKFCHGRIIHAIRLNKICAGVMPAHILF